MFTGPSLDVTYAVTATFPEANVGARSRYFALRHLEKMSQRAVGTYPQVACLAFDVISNSIAVDGRFEREELEALAKHVFPRLNGTEVCLDIGANIGNHSLFFARHFREVHAFEPHPRIYPLLDYNAALADNVTTYPFGCSSEEGTFTAAAVSGNIGMTSVGREGGETKVELQLKRLDEVPAIKALSRIDFVKIDVEGHEAEAFEGARETLQAHRPVVALEILAPEISEGTSRSIQTLKSIGYKHFYALRSHRPFASAPKPLAKAATALAGLLFDKRPEKSFTLEPVEKLDVRNHPLVIASVTPLI